MTNQMKTVVIILISILSAFCLTGLLSAEKYTFRVPVEMRNIHKDIKTGFVYCAIYPTANHREPVAGKEIQLNLSTDGKTNYFNRTLVVVLDLTSEQAQTGKYWKCSLYLKNPQGGDQSPSNMFAHGNPWGKLDNSKRFRYTVNGKFN